MDEEIKKNALEAFENAKPYLSDFKDFKEYVMEVIDEVETEEGFLDEVENYKEGQDSEKGRETDVRIFLQKYDKIH